MNSTSNEIFSANRTLFCARFPDLACILGLDSPDGTQSLFDAVPPSYHIEETRSGNPTLRVKETYVHSRHDPLRDASRAVEDTSSFTRNGCLFAGIGLAYIPELYARKFPEATLIVIEPDIFLFLLCLVSRPLKSFLSHPGLILIIGTPPREVISLLEKLELTDISVYQSPSLTAPNQGWFSDFEAMRKRNKEKKEINANTLKRFGDLWLKNMCRNLGQMRDRRGIGAFKDAFRDVPALVLAAGPSLDRILPHLSELRKKCLIIAVDTAVRACVRASSEPDFIILVDPQYWNFRHLDGLSCPKSILITESAAWPAVFRFKCRSIHLCSSLFPLGKFLESRTAIKGELGAGGSVSTTAWDFARHLGCTHIYMAGLDLGFPDKKTHFTGSIFEDRTHTSSDRLNTAETAGYSALYGGGPYPVPDYRGKTVLTDKRLILYAWWFESRLAAFPGNKTATLTPEGVKIPGFSIASTEDLESGPEIRTRIDRNLTRILSSDDGKQDSAEGKAFDDALTELKKELFFISGLSTQAVKLCESALKGQNQHSGKSICDELNRIDHLILDSTAKEIASMVFPVSSKGTRGEIGTESGKNSSGTSVFSESRAVYINIKNAAKKNLDNLEKFS